jgi:CubicO group peptidase (beta-lactamase class C family)
VLEKITGLPLALGLQRYVIEPMKLTQTRSFSTPTIPEPVLHAFSSERRGDLLIPSSIPFYEESTFWNPSWTTAEGAVQTTDLSDMARSMEIVGTGKLLSPSSWSAQVSPNLVGFGHSDPKCGACQQNTAAANYGLGVVNLGPWITQTKNFAGSGATAGYFPSGRITVGVVTTYNPEAFDSTTGNYDNASTAIFKILGNIVAPNTLAVPK